MDRADLEQQLESLHPASFAWALACCGRDRDGAEEVLQETYLKILEGSARFEGRSSLKTWLFSVIRRVAASRRRLLWLRSWRLVDADFDEMMSGHESVEERIVYSERAGALLRAIARLARRQREVIELVFYHEITIDQAAQVLSISVGAARVHYHRAKRNLETELNREESK